MPKVFAFSGSFVRWSPRQDDGSAIVWYTAVLSLALFALVEPFVQVAVIQEGLIAGNMEEQNGRKAKRYLDSAFFLFYLLN